MFGELANDVKPPLFIDLVDQPHPKLDETVRCLIHFVRLVRQSGYWVCAGRLTHVSQQLQYQRLDIEASDGVRLIAKHEKMRGFNLFAPTFSVFDGQGNDRRQVPQEPSLLVFSPQKPSASCISPRDISMTAKGLISVRALLLLLCS